jgi:hypothetical protein
MKYIKSKHKVFTRVWRIFGGGGYEKNPEPLRGV